MGSDKGSVDILCSFEEIALDISERFPRLGVTRSHLTVPTSDLVRKVFSAYLTEVFQCILPQQFHDNQMLANCTEVYQHILPTIKLYRGISIILQSNSFDGFTISDITDPTPKRTLTIFALLENSAKFWDIKHTDTLQPLFEELKNRSELYASLFAQKEQLRQEANDRATNKSQREIQTKQLSKQMELKKRNINALSEEQAVINAKVNQAKSELYKVTQSCENLTEACRNIDKQNADLSKQVVMNPDDLVKELATVRNELDLKMTEVKSVNEKVHSRKTNTNQYQQIAERQQHSTTLLKEIVSSSIYLQKKEAEIDSWEGQCKSVTEDMKGDQDSVAAQQDVKKKLQDHVLRLKMQKETKASQIKKSLNVAKEEYLHVQKKHDDLLRKYAKLEESKGESKKHIQTLTENILKISSHTKIKDDELVAEENKFDIELEKVIQNVEQQLKLQLKMM